VTGVALGLGGNIGDSRRLLAAAIRLIASHPRIALGAVSSLYLTPPWGKIDQPAFLNAAILIDTTLSPRDLLDAMLDIERQLGRERRERWGPRRIDIDILLFGSIAVDEPGLHIPHPRLKERAFALVPLRDIEPDAVIEGRGISEWIAESDRQGMQVLAEPGWHETA
jgi:2-amino-4-hydroxy-6-hydroxymethyldihydropteridine diphosphokinase